VRGFQLFQPGERVKLMCIGAHADDIEIGAGGTILSWLEAGVELDVHWCVGSAAEGRRLEACKSASAFLCGAASRYVHFGDLTDGYFPYEGTAAKDWVESLKAIQPDLILTHYGKDAHQDHRLISELTWNTFRDHQILEYEIPKWDGDMGQPNFYVRLTSDVVDRKLALLREHFPSQLSRPWFEDDTFRGLARIRGMEAGVPERFAEGFYVRKAVFSAPPCGGRSAGMLQHQSLENVLV
jgi:LmbE family N-acetylglucosaminyl deacetylase